MEESVGVLGGLEVWNNARAFAYAAAGIKPCGMTVLDCGCPKTRELLDCDADPYSTPAADLAPWYDSQDDDSAHFGGFFVSEVTGFEDSPYTRPLTERLSDGATIGRKRAGSRTIVVTGVLLANTEPGLAYGYRWLVQALASACTSEGCGGEVLQMLHACPDLRTATDEQIAAAATRYWRSVFDVVLLKGPTVLEEFGGSCQRCSGSCGAKKVEFTLAAGVPFLFSDTMCVETDPRSITDGDQVCVSWTTGPCLDCNSSDDPLLDPRSGGLALPSAPSPITTACEPLVSIRTAESIPLLLERDWFESVPLITITSGSSDLRNLTLNFYEDPRGLGCTDTENPCSDCATIVVSYVPANSTLVLDGRVQRATVTTPGGINRDASSVVFGGDGGPVVWPVLGCVPYCMSTRADALATADDATIAVCLAGREA